jgi:hypothetical protein
MPAQREVYTPAVEARSILRESLAPSRQRALSETHSAYPTGGRLTLPAVKANLSTYRGDLTVRVIVPIVLFREIRLSQTGGC